MSDETPRSEQASPFDAFDGYRYAFAGFGLLLFAVTWRLWTPQSEFPQIPFVALLTVVPAFVDWMSMAVAAIALFITLRTHRDTVRRPALIAFATSATTLVLCNQHRFQPWTYQLIVFGLIMASCRRATAMNLMRWIVASIYVYSAISKFDYQFLHSLGPQFLTTLVGFVGMSTDNWSDNAVLILSSLFPIGELCVGVSLLLPRTRRIGTIVAIVLHVMLLLILGPWGLNHRPGVLIWNLFFISQAYFLFWLRSPERISGENESRIGFADRVSQGIAIIVIVFPLTESFGYCDHWPAWELYSPRNSRAFVAIHKSAIGRLSPGAQRNLGASVPGNDWHQLHLDQWSLNSFSTPIYPEDRFQIAVANALAQQCELGLAIHVTHHHASNRFTGERKEASYRGQGQIEAAAEDFLLNVAAR